MRASALDAVAPQEGLIRIVCRYEAEARQTVIEVIDNGSGIDPAIRHKIFDPFFTTKPHGMGTGLGLSISHGIMEDHGGQIALECPAGGGAHFTVMLPARTPS